MQTIILFIVLHFHFQNGSSLGGNLQPEVGLLYHYNYNQRQGSHLMVNLNPLIALPTMWLNYLHAPIDPSLYLEAT